MPTVMVRWPEHWSWKSSDERRASDSFVEKMRKMDAKLKAEAFNERVRIAREDLDRQVKAKMEEIIPLATRIFQVARRFEYEAEITTFNNPFTAKSGMNPPESRVSFISDIGKVKIINPHSKTLEQMDRKLVKELERLSNPVRKSRKKKQSRKCEEKLNSLCSGQGNVRSYGKWMCFHCEREYEYLYVHDGA